MRGFAVCTDGVIDLDTVMQDREQSARFAVGKAGYMIVGPLCSKAGCDCVDKMMDELLPKSQLVEVEIEIGS